MASADRNGKTPEPEEGTAPPFLRRVRIQGYKSIALCDIRLHPLTLLVGRNGAGKSNFLDALAFLRDVMESSLSEALRRRGGWSAVACRTGNGQRIDFDLEMAFTSDRPYVASYKLELAVEANAPTIARESLEIEDRETRRRANFEVHRGIIQRETSTPDSAEPIPLPHSWHWVATLRPDRPLLSVIGSPPFGALGEKLGSMGFYNFSPEEIRRLQPPSPGLLLEKSGRNLASVIEGLNEIDPDSVQRMREYLSAIADDVESFDVVRAGGYETIRFRLKSGGEFDAAGMSDGTLRALAALAAAFQVHLPSGPSVVGIEEAETSLHPAATRALVDALREATGRTQVLLTTHSGDLLADRDLDPSCLLVVRNRNGQTQIAPVDAASREIIRKELYTLADLQRMDQLELDEADLQRQAAAPGANEEG
jgi:predicted ATPase